MILNSVIVSLTGLAMFWALFVLGATETQNLYRLFLALVFPVFLVLIKIVRRPNIDRATLITLLVGVFLLAGIVFNGTLEGRGYVHLWVAWAAYLIFSQVARDGEPSFKLAVGSLLLMGALEGIYALLQVTIGFRFNMHPEWMPGVATGSLYNRNHFAGMMNMFFPLSLGVLLAFYQRGLKRAMERTELLSQMWLLSLLSSLLGLTILLSLSRAGIASLAAALVSVTLYLLLGKGFRQVSGGWKLTALLLVLVIVFGAVFNLDQVVDRVGQATNHLHERVQIYRDTARLIADHPWLGIGPGMFIWAFRPYQSVGGRIWYDFAHNDYLQSAAEWGLPLALIFWSWVVGRLVRIASLASLGSQNWMAGFYLGCATGILTILIHSLVDFNLYIPTNAMLFMALLGIPRFPPETDLRLRPVPGGAV